MAIEIERKFLVKGDGWRPGAEGVRYRQGYLARSPGQSVRVRMAGERAYLTVKAGHGPLSRLEFEYSIPAEDAEQMLDRLCGGRLIDKTRYRVSHRGRVWEVDEFHGENRGLVLAEVELQAEDDAVDLPPWAGEEVTADPRYYNANLVAHPFREWGRGG